MSAPPVHPAVAWAAALLDDTSDTWCVLRGDLTLERAGADIDVLAPAGAIPLIEKRLVEEGALVLRSGASAAPVTFIVHRSGVWLKLDVSSTLRIRSLGDAPPDVIGSCLSRGERQDGLNRLPPGDEFWALFLHCLLNRRDFPGRAVARLQELAPAASAETELTKWASEGLGLELTPADALAIARGGSPTRTAAAPRLALRRPARLQRAYLSWTDRLRQLPLRGRSGLIIDSNVAAAKLREALRGYPLPARVVSAREPWGTAIAHYHRVRGRLVVLTKNNKGLLESEAGDGGHVVELGRMLWERHATHLRRHVSNA